MQLSMPAQETPDWSREQLVDDRTANVEAESWNIQDSLRTPSDQHFLSEEISAEDFLRFENGLLPHMPSLLPTASNSHEDRRFGMQLTDSQADVSPNSQTQDSDLPSAYSLIVPDSLVEHL